jgi:hypothetical protein
MNGNYVVTIQIKKPDGQRMCYDLALSPHEMGCLEPLPDPIDLMLNPGAAFAAAAQIEARRRLAERIGRIAADNACDAIESLHADVEPTRSEINRACTEARANPLFLRFGAGRY